MAMVNRHRADSVPCFDLPPELIALRWIIYFQALLHISYSSLALAYYKQWIVEFGWPQLLSWGSRFHIRLLSLLSEAFLVSMPPPVDALKKMCVQLVFVLLSHSFHCATQVLITHRAVERFSASGHLREETWTPKFSNKSRCLEQLIYNEIIALANLLVHFVKFQFKARANIDGIEY